jgi:hypothetical protein
MTVAMELQIAAWGAQLRQHINERAEQGLHFVFTSD